MSRLHLVLPFLLSSSLVLADFPAEEAWRVELDTTATVLGPNWQDDEGQTFFLIGLRNKAVIISEEEIVWESPELPGRITALNRVDFGAGDGPEIFVGAVGDEGIVFAFSGEDYQEQQVLAIYMSEEYIERNYREAYDFRHITAINYFDGNLPDSTKTLIVSIYKYFGHTWEDGSSDDSWWGDIVTEAFDVNGDNETDLIFGRYSCFSYWDYENGGSDSRYLSLRINNSDFDTLGYRDIASRRSPGCYLTFFKLLAFPMADSAMLSVSYSDTSGFHLDFMSLPELATLYSYNVRMVPICSISYPIGEHESDVYLLCKDEQNRIIVIHINDFHYSDIFQDFNPTALNCESGDFDVDEELEMAVLTLDEFIMYNLGRLSTPSSSEPLWIPEQYVITAAYPNPFNSTATIEYVLPGSGRYEITVLDLTGREVERLVDGWSTPGKHALTWNAAGFQNGTYFISLNSGDYRSVRKIQLLK